MSEVYLEKSYIVCSPLTMEISVVIAHNNNLLEPGIIQRRLSIPA